MANILRCKKCGDIITSDERHDMNWCKCGAIAIDGGDDYCKITGNPEDMEVFVPSKLLEEKERELKRIKKNWELSKGQQRRLYDSLKLRCKDALEQIDEEKISLCIEKLEKVKKYAQHIQGKLINYIDDQIKQLKEMK